MQLQLGANAGRTDDLKRIKTLVAERINREYKPTVYLIAEERTNRGLQHDVCGRLLCPIMYDWDDLECVPISFRDAYYV